jgi:peptidoglycan/LPS O-acetylase OafA/YrhL
MSEAVAAKKKYPSIDVLRAVSAVGIVMMHLISKSNNQYELEGFLAETVIPWFTHLVYLFMMISAFGMCCGYHERMLRGTIDLSSFYRKRVSRVLPYFSFLVVLDLLSDFSFERLLEGFAEVTLVFGFLPETNKFTVLGIAWFLGITFVFYALFPLFSVLTETKAAAWKTMAVAVIFNFACNYYFFNRDHYPNGFYARQNILFSAMFFVAGGLVYLYRSWLCERLGAKWPVTIIISMTFTVLYFALPIINRNKYLQYPYFVLIFALWLISAIVHDFELTGFFGRFIRLLAMYSMEIYLTHMMIFRILQKLGLNYLFGRGYISYLFTVILSIAGALATAIVFQRIRQIISCLPGRKSPSDF